MLCVSGSGLPCRLRLARSRPLQSDESPARGEAGRVDAAAAATTGRAVATDTAAAHRAVAARVEATRAAEDRVAANRATADRAAATAVVAAGERAGSQSSLYHTDYCLLLADETKGYRRLLLIV